MSDPKNILIAQLSLLNVSVEKDFYCFDIVLPDQKIGIIDINKKEQTARSAELMSKNGWEIIYARTKDYYFSYVFDLILRIIKQDDAA